MQLLCADNRSPSMQRLALALFLCLMNAPGGPSRSNANDEFEPLFPHDGAPEGWSARQWDDVSRTAAAAVWTVDGGVLQSGEPRGSWLMSDREFGDFELEFEFKLGPRGNSGLALRAPLDGDPAFDGIELQMVDRRYNTNALDSELTGGLYRAVAPRSQKYVPTEWNRYKIRLKGAKLHVELNGEVIHDLDLDEQRQTVKRHDGGDAPTIQNRPRRGHIGFQDLSRDDDRVRIRGARIREL